MTPHELIDFLRIAEKLKCNTRHGWTTNGRQESVADHSWRLSLMALLLTSEFPDVDMNKVLKMCLIHDLGEAITGDIPSFYKTDKDEKNEEQAIEELLNHLPEEIRLDWAPLFQEMTLLATPEARLYKCMDKLEAVIQHNEASLETWIDLEYELNRVYGRENCEEFPYMKSLRVLLEKNTIEKIKKESISLSKIE